jgi:hypothetical protein
MSSAPRPGEEIATLDRHGSHRLISRDGRFAVIECRNGNVYGVSGGDRPGFAETGEGIAAAVGEAWTDEATARRLFDDIAQRGETLAQRIW